ncbi:MAG: hypothetical protein ACRERX_20665 [Pseudomonas sp.]
MHVQRANSELLLRKGAVNLLLETTAVWTLKIRKICKRDFGTRGVHRNAGAGYFVPEISSLRGLRAIDRSDITSWEHPVNVNGRDHHGSCHQDNRDRLF